MQCPSAAARPLAAKWDRYYAAGPAGSAPFDSARPSSQLIDYLCSCVHDAVSSSTEPLEAAAITQLASQAALRLPPEFPDEQELHVCAHCAAYKPPQGVCLST